jgi:hypothetical protein
LDQDIENMAIRIDRPPQIVPLPMEGNPHHGTDAVS